MLMLSLTLAGVTALRAPVAVPPATWVSPVGEPTSGPSVIHLFDPPATPYAAGHRGVDLLSTPGAPVRATADGVVTYAGAVAGRGVVVVSHGPLRSTYEPVDASVTVGQRVHAGDVLGRLSGGAGHCGLRSCLHWGLLLGARYLDPLSVLGHAPIRLLPVWGVSQPSRLDSLLNAVTGAVKDTGLPSRTVLKKLPTGGPPERRQAGALQPAALAAGALSLVGAGAGAIGLRRRR